MHQTSPSSLKKQYSSQNLDILLNSFPNLRHKWKNQPNECLATAHIIQRLSIRAYYSSQCLKKYSFEYLLCASTLLDPEVTMINVLLSLDQVRNQQRRITGNKMNYNTVLYASAILRQLQNTWKEKWSHYDGKAYIHCGQKEARLISDWSRHLKQGHQHSLFINYILCVCIVLKTDHQNNNY